MQGYPQRKEIYINTILRQRIIMGHMGMDVVNTASRMKRSIIPKRDVVQNMLNEVDVR